MFAERIDDYNARVDRALAAALPGAEELPSRLHAAMRYSVFNGGKRVRPLLVYATGECLGVEAERLDAPAAAIELIHAFSLVHDDLPAMDDDDLRRGQPTVHKQYDEATAILAADALQPLAFRVLSNAPGLDDATRLELITSLADACGSLGMTGGQSLDLDAEGKTLEAKDVEQMFRLKTGALIAASVHAAAAIARTRPAARESLQVFADSIGLAFQIRDDLLDVEGETETIGKPAGSDAGLDKASYPAVAGLDASRARCAELMSEGLAALECFGDAAEPLAWLAQYIVERRS